MGNPGSMSYAPIIGFSRAHLAAAELAGASQAKATVQIGTYRERANAERIAERFGRFGEIVIHNDTSAGRTFYVVQIVTNAGDDAAQGRLLAAASAAGISDAFVTSR